MEARMTEEKDTTADEWRFLKAWTKDGGVEQPEEPAPIRRKLSAIRGRKVYPR